MPCCPAFYGLDETATSSSPIPQPTMPSYPHSIMTPLAMDIHSDTSDGSVEQTQLVPLSFNSRNLSGQKRPLHDASTSTVTRVNTQHRDTSPGCSHTKSGLNKTELRRERNRIHQAAWQARYKMKQHKLVTDLEKRIEYLRTEIQELKLQRRLIHCGIPINRNLWGTATEFFRLFRSSVRPPLPTGDSTGTQSEYIVQQNFLRATMVADVTDGRVCGVDALLQTWALQSLCYERIDLQPVRLENGPRDSLVAITKGYLVINENTLCYAFPHLVSDSRWSTIAARMLGQQLTLRGSVHFEWDSVNSRVTSIVCKADILTPLLHLFGNLDEVSCVFENARLTPDGRLVVSESIRVS
ncbi:hypothetical protein L917_02544 [Phytophthora nicotianae]|uniref:BZIP domain-containing protein n=1 Tax=Phytophthora nicotianae TaxID=4792 RepID=W2LTS7_PHYNI|nr:hypothetical protein L917_02544 [Phytophthora nicotianae]